MRRSVHVIGSRSRSSSPSASAGRPARRPTPPSNASSGGSDQATADDTGQRGGMRPIARPPIAHKLPAEPVDQEPAPGGRRGPAPVAADLAEYVKDLPGSGPLMATIETSLGTIHCQLYSASGCR